jgi:hypothetical protein
MPVCPVCNQRKAKRACPALGRQICAVCCGTKRIVEISCPTDCGYLTSARTNPPAIVRRQQELDRAMLLPLMQSLSERQARIFLMLGAVAARHHGELLHRLADEDIAGAAGALAATFETAAKGIVYEHQPESLPAARLMTELKALVDEIAKSAGATIQRDAAIALRRLEHGARAMATMKSGANEFQQLLNRVLLPPPGSQAMTDAGAGPKADRETPAPSIIIP